MKTLIIALLISCSIYAQDNISIEVYQDLKFATIGDKERGYKAGTLDLVLRLSLQGFQDKHGYFVVSPEFEYAEIEGIYKRYSANVGYTLNKLFIPKSETSLMLGWGWIDRYGKTSFSGSGSLSYKYLINDKLKVVAMSQFTQRTDLNGLIRFSGFVGLEFNLR